MNYAPIEKNFKTMTAQTQKLVDKFNQSCISIKNQELAVEQLRNKIETLQMYKDTGVITERELTQLDYLPQKLEIAEEKLKETKSNASELGKELNKAMKNRQIKSFGSEVSKIGTKIDKFKTKMSRLVGTAMVFSLLRNKLASLRSSFTSLLKTDDQFVSSLNQIKANLMTAFAPIYNACLPTINSLMNTLSKITGTIAMFVSNLFGTSLKNATKDAKKLSSSLNKVGSSAKKAGGSLASIDKLEVLQDNSNDGGGSNSNSIDYSGEISYSQQLLDFLNKIKDFIVQNQDYFISFIWGLISAVAMLKIGLSGITSLGIGVTIAGIVLLIKSVIEYLNDPSWENFGKMVTSIGLIIAGVALLFGAWPVALAGACVAIMGILVSNWSKIEEFGLNAIKWIEDHIDEIGDKFGNMGRFIAGVIQGLIQTGLDYFGDFLGGIKKVVDGIIKIFKGDLKGGIKTALDGIKTFCLAPINAIINGVNTLINGLNKIKFDVPDWVPGIGGKTLGFNIPKIPKLATGAVIPPRQEFMAILGDQKHGTNIEAPLETIKQATREVLSEFLGNMGINGKDKEIVLKNWQFVLQLGNNKTFAKMVIDEIKKYERETNTQFLLS